MKRDPAVLADGTFDVVVVGGGVTGAAIAWDAAQRGLSVALVERGDFGGATSANSLKVVHGGIRYLQHLDVARVRESSRERSAWLRIAPHLVRPMPVLVPAYGHGVRGPEAIAAAFALLEALTAVRNRGLRDPGRRIPRARLISRAETSARCPELARGDLTGAGLFWDGQLLNPPRLVWELIRTAGGAGAVAANYCEVRHFVRRAERIVGVDVEDLLGGGRFLVRGRVVVNAAGPFAEELYVRDGLRAARQVPLSRDMALVIRRPLVGEQAVAVQTGYRDPDALLSRGSRHLFVVPWRGVTLAGVSSIVYPGDPFTLTTTESEVEGFVREINQAVPAWRVSLDDVALVHAGLLPIGSPALRDANVSFGKRPYLVDNSGTDGVEGLVTAIANRFTIARGLAQRAVDLVFRKLGHSPPRCVTSKTPLWGGDEIDPSERGAALVGDLSPERIERLKLTYGSAWREVAALLEAEPSLGDPVGATPTLKVEVAYAVRHEMARTLADCLFRRTDLGTAGDPGEAALAECAELTAAELGWSEVRTRSELAEVRARFFAPASSPLHEERSRM
jgi:glycerol-3-phosphate dehydrogenase